MKSLITLTALILISNVHAADIKCAKLKRFVRPVSKDAIILAKHLNVKTCTGQRYINAVKKLKTKIVMVKPTKAQVELYGLSKSNENIDLSSLFTK